MTKLQIISDKNIKSTKIKNLLIKKINQEQFEKENLIIVIGGDGFMLQTLKKNKNSNKQFYGINSGNYGFLMNKFSSKNIIKNLSKAKMITISPIEMIVQSNSKWCRDNLSSRNLILTGGCALNNDAVRKIRKDWNYIYVPKNPGDPGSCIGAVLALESKHIDFDQQVWYNK